MTRLVTGSLFAGAFNSIRNLLDAQRVVASGVYSQFSQANSSYPTLVVESANTDPFLKSFGRDTQGKRLNIEITCVSQSMKQLDEMADDVERILLQNQAALASSGLSQLVLNASNTLHQELNEKLTHSKVLNANFTWIGGYT